MGARRVELIAHRAGNRAAAFAAVRSVADVVEIDVHLVGGVPVARHAKRLWPTSRLWERWYLLPRDTRVPTLAEAIAAMADTAVVEADTATTSTPDDGADPSPALWIDGKGVTPRLPAAALDRVAASPLGGPTPERPVTVSSKSWWMLAPVAGRPSVRVVRSAGNRVELALLRRLPSRVALDGVVVKSTLLDGPLVTELRSRFGTVFTWRVPDARTGRRLVADGVDGLIVDEPEVLAELRRDRADGTLVPGGR